MSRIKNSITISIGQNDSGPAFVSFIEGEDGVIAFRNSPRNNVRER